MSYVSRSNSTDVILSTSTTFTGLSEINDEMWVAVSCFSDVEGILYFDFSVDDVNWNSFPTNGFNVSAGIHEFHTALKLGRAFRVRYVNGSADQTVFRLKTYYGAFAQPSAPLNQPLGLDADAILVRPSFPWLDVARGLTTGFTSVTKFGRNSSVGTTFTPIARGGIYRTPQASGATTLRIKAGGDANDTAAGSGARQITLQGLDETFTEVTETLTTVGASASAVTSTTFTRLYRCFVSESGTYASTTTGSHSGTITIENGAGGTDWTSIDATDFPKGQSEIGAFSVAAGKTGYVKLRNLSVDSGKTIDLVFFSRTNIDQTTAPYDAIRAQSVVTGVTGGSIETFGWVEIPLGPYVGPTDVGFMAKVNAGSATVGVEFEIIILDE